MRIQHTVHTATGRRSNNEDAYLVAPKLGLYAVADGMGGYEGGEVASRAALESLRAYFVRLGETNLDLERDADGARHQLRMAIRIADRDVSRRAVGELCEMGTTLVCMVVRGARALIAHVGDSRIYLLRDGELEQLTRDHSLVAEMEAAGLNAAPNLQHVITQAIGQGPAARPDLRAIDVMPGDRFLLCSDGLTDVLGPDEIAGTMGRRSPARALVELAYERGSMDNITALVVSAR